MGSKIPQILVKVEFTMLIKTEYNMRGSLNKRIIYHYWINRKPIMRLKLINLNIL